VRRSAILFVEWMVINAFPKVAQRCLPLFMGALHAA
jgi:hypothetical protein